MNMSEVTIKTIPRQEWDSILSLSVQEQQRHFIETAQHCLNDAQHDAYNMKWSFYGVYVEGRLIGFAMHGKLRFWGMSQVWLDRFMIDRAHQGKGYGKQAMARILERMYDEYKCRKIYLSVHESNVAAIALYQTLGFRKTLFKDGKGERIMTRRK